MNRSRIAVKTGELLAVMLIFLFFVWVAFSTENQRIQTGSPVYSLASTAPEKTIAPDAVGTSEPAPLEDYLDLGMKKLLKGRYKEAADNLRKARDLDPGSPVIRYYLMLSMLQLEKMPYQENSETMENALAVIKMAPGTDMARRAKKVIDENQKETARVDRLKTEIRHREILAEARKKTGTEKLKKPESASSPNKSNDKASAQTKAVVIEETGYYPKADTPKAPADKKLKSRQGEKPRNKALDLKTATLQGSVSRPDERGVQFAPRGIELTLIQVNGAEEYYARTDWDGNFRFTGLKPGASYLLVAQSKYRYADSFEEYQPYRWPYPPPREDARPRSDDGKNPLEYDPQKGKVAQEQFFSRQAPRVWTGEGYIYYPPTIDPAYNQPYPRRQVNREFNVSWHLRMTLNEPGIYSLDLTPRNADAEYDPRVEPKYDPVTLKPYREVMEVVPRRVD